MSRGDMDLAVREVGDRARARHSDPSVRVTHVEPWTLKPRPVGQGDKPRRRGGVRLTRRPPVPDEQRCVALNRGGTRCRNRAEADGLCLHHARTGQGR